MEIYEHHRKLIEIQRSEADIKIMRSRCQATAKPMSRSKNTRVSSDREADVEKEVHTRVKRPRSRRQGECEADVKTNAKPMSRRPRSRCREGTHAHTPNGSTHAHKQIDAKWKHAVRCFISVCNDYYPSFYFFSAI